MVSPRFHKWRIHTLSLRRQPQSIGRVNRNVRSHDAFAERIQHTWMRLAVTLHGGNLERVLETYELLSQGFYTHASPTIFNAGLRKQQLVSCYVPQVDVSTSSAPFNTVCDVANILMANGGVGLDMHQVPAKRCAAHTPRKTLR